MNEDSVSSGPMFPPSSSLSQSNSSESKVAKTQVVVTNQPMNSLDDGQPAVSLLKVDDKQNNNIYCQSYPM